jgi:hypothetical protein
MPMAAILGLAGRARPWSPPMPATRARNQALLSGADGGPGLRRAYMFNILRRVTPEHPREEESILWAGRGP